MNNIGSYFNFVNYGRNVDNFESFNVLLYTQWRCAGRDFETVWVAQNDFILNGFNIIKL